MDIITLKGDLKENFYKLGLADRKCADAVHNDVKLMIRTPWNIANKVVEEIGKSVLKNTLLKNSSSYYQYIQAYSEGLGKSLEETAYMMLVPEMVSCMSKWIPTLTRSPFGCSSFITRNKKGEVIHGRILDFPLHGSFDLNERAISYQLDDMPKMLGFGACGIPYPSITLMTEEGMTLALHEKFTPVFNSKGLSIFEYIFKLTQNANDKASVIEFVNNHQTITTWCLNITFKNGDALSIDISAHEVSIHEFQIPDKGFIYFANELVNEELPQEDYLPYGFTHYNKLRKSIAEEKIKNFMETHDENPSELELLELMSVPLKQELNSDFSNYRLDNINCSSLSAMVMNPSAQKSLYITGEAPKFLRDNVIEINHAFSSPEKKHVKIKKALITDDNYHSGNKALMRAQKAFDKKDSIEIYHQLQTAIDLLENYPEEQIAKFYFLIAQFLFESHHLVLEKVLRDFKQMQDNLPESLNDHCLLFISRLERILGLHPSLESDKIKNKRLLNILKKEEKIPKLIYRKVLKNLVAPRLDILDVIYLMTP